MSKSINIEDNATGGNRPASGDGESFAQADVFGAAISANTQVFLHDGATFGAAGKSPNEDIMYIINEAVCDDAGAQGVIDPGGLRQMAIVYKLETNDQIACQNI